MNKKTTGLLFGIGAGLGLAWLFRGKLFRLMGDKRLTIVLKTVTPGVKAGVEAQPDDVTAVEHTRITWNVINDSDKDVVVSLANWNNGHGQPRPPAVDPDEDADDPEQPPQRELSRLVPKGKKRKIRAKARKASALIEIVHYDVNLDGEKGVDPIVKLVL